MLLKTFKYRLYPTKEQQRLLTRQLEECRWLWNTLLAERKQAWEELDTPPGLKPHGFSGNAHGNPSR